MRQSEMLKTEMPACGWSEPTVGYLYKPFRVRGKGKVLVVVVQKPELALVGSGWLNEAADPGTW